MKPDPLQDTDVAIIGAGPAGMTAAIQLKRYGIPFVLLEKERIGGLLWNASLVENYPGFPAGVSGPKLIGLVSKQMERIGVEVTFDSVTSMKQEENRFLVATSHASFCSRYIIVATGTKPRPFPLTIPDGAQNRVFSDVYRLLEEREKQIVIVGAGDAAFDYALNMTKNRNSVTILNRGGEVKCLKLLWDRALADPSIAYRAETPVRSMAFEETANRLKIRLDAGEVIEADYLLFAIGRAPQTGFLSEEFVNNKVDGLYFVGDVKNGLYRQAAIAAGDGLRAAMDIYFNMEA